MIANKLKCLLQRRHVPDVYDLVYSTFINREIAVNRQEVLTAFFRKTIYERSPGVARQLLLDLPLLALKTAWSKYIIAPVQGLLDFDDAVQHFQSIINEFFAAYPVTSRAAFAYFPSHLRAPIMQAGAESRLIRLTYDGVRRDVEPYSLAYKQRADGHREEYLYVYDRTGGRTSGPGIKSFFNYKIQDLQVLDEVFEPRHPINLAKAVSLRASTISASLLALVEVSGAVAGNTAARLALYGAVLLLLTHIQTNASRHTLKPHKDGYGNNCFGRRGVIIDQHLV